MATKKRKTTTKGKVIKIVPISFVLPPLFENIPPPSTKRKKVKLEKWAIDVNAITSIDLKMDSFMEGISATSSKGGSSITPGK